MPTLQTVLQHGHRRRFVVAHLATAGVTIAAALLVAAGRVIG
jgi:hypothetical protein